MNKIPGGQISNTYLGDCMEYMKLFNDKYFDIAVVNPPFQVDRFKKGGSVMKFSGAMKKWDFKPQKEYFIELERVSKKMIIWGGNNFDLPASPGWIVWRKQDIAPSFGQCELAWSNFDTPIKFWQSATEKNKIHPCQKPILLYAWLYNNYSKAGKRVLDTHMGSQSSRIAAYKMGYDYYGCEINEKYYQEGNDRFYSTIKEPLFDNNKNINQEMFSK